jgi:hypothetical protein
MFDGSLFTRDFLAEGILQEADWKHLSDAAAKAMAGKIEALLTRFPHSKKPNESQTEDDVVWAILAALGWSNHLRQQNLSARGRDDIPDGYFSPTQTPRRGRTSTMKNGGDTNTASPSSNRSVGTGSWTGRIAGRKTKASRPRKSSAISAASRI